jgi:hypothetical protein
MPFYFFYTVLRPGKENRRFQVPVTAYRKGMPIGARYKSGRYTNTIGQKPGREKDMKVHFVLTSEKAEGVHLAAYDGYEETDAYPIKISFYDHISKAYVFPAHFYTKEQAEAYITAVGSDPQDRTFYQVLEYRFKDGRTPVAQLSPTLLNNDTCCFPSPQETYNITYSEDRQTRFINTIRTLYFSNKETARQYVEAFNTEAAALIKKAG